MNQLISGDLTTGYPPIFAVPKGNVERQWGGWQPHWQFEKGSILELASYPSPASIGLFSLARLLSKKARSLRLLSKKAREAYHLLRRLVFDPF